MSKSGPVRFNPPPGWPRPPDGWTPPSGWTPDPTWPEPPPGWQLWIATGEGEAADHLNQGQAPNQPGSTVQPSRSAQAGADETVDQRVSLLEAENAALRARLESDGLDPGEIVVLDDDRILQDIGIYRYHHPLENAVAYRSRLDEIAARIADLIKADAAIEKSNMFTFDGSLAKGRRMTADLAKLMLRGYNAEAENVIRSLRAGNVVTAKKRLEATRRTIAKLGKMMAMHISDRFHALRFEEIELTADYQMKKQEEREAAREERARLREERKVAQELTAERERLEKERTHLAIALDRLKASGSGDPELERKLAELDGAISRNDNRAANIRAGYVYVASNRGAFGGHIVKIGLTRRLEPLERINELGDASVPFRFDVHALYFSEDAVTLETELHQHFSERRMNWVNMRREFFFATPAEVRVVLAEKVGNLLEFTEHCESEEYLRSVHYWRNVPGQPTPLGWSSSATSTDSEEPG